MRTCILVIFLIIATHSYAQSYVSDKEHYLKPAEIARVDSMLSEYRKLTGNIVLLSTDTANPGALGYVSEIYTRYFPDSTSTSRVLMLLMSRKNQTVIMVASKPLMPLLGQPQMMEMIMAGASSLQAGRREEGVTLILKKGMETLQKIQ